MIGPIAFDRGQRLRLRLRSHDRELGVEVSEHSESSLWLQLNEPAIWLDDRLLEGGVDLSFWRAGVRHLAEDLPVLTFDLDRGRIQVERPLSTNVVQRRRTFREMVEVPVRLARADAEPDTLDLSPERGITQDLGGGGLCLQTEGTMPVTVNEEVQIELELPEHAVRARGRVRWAIQGSDGTTKIGVAFTRIAEREQDRVYGFLFDLQRHRLRPATA